MTEEQAQRNYGQGKSVLEKEILPESEEKGHHAGCQRPCQRNWLYPETQWNPQRILSLEVGRHGKDDMIQFTFLNDWLTQRNALEKGKWVQSREIREVTAEVIQVWKGIDSLPNINSNHKSTLKKSAKAFFLRQDACPVIALTTVIG